MRDPRQVADEATSAGEDGGSAQLAAASVVSEWGCVVKHERDGSEYLIDVVMNVEEAVNNGSRPRKGNLQSRFKVRPMGWDGKTRLEHEDGHDETWSPGDVTVEPRVVQVPLSQIDNLSSVRIYAPKELVSIESRMRVQRAVNEVVRRFPDGVPMLSPETDMRIDVDNFRKLKKRIDGLEAMMNRHPLHGSPDLDGKVSLFAKRRELTLQHKIAKRRLKAAQGMIHKDDLRHMHRVLRRLNYTDEDGVVAMKGEFILILVRAIRLTSCFVFRTGGVRDHERRRVGHHRARVRRFVQGITPGPVRRRRGVPDGARGFRREGTEGYQDERGVQGGV